MPPQTPRHVALLTTCLDVSGAERVLALLADGLAREGYRVSVVALQRRSGALRDLIHHPDVEVVDLGMQRPWDLGVIWRLRRWLATERVSVVYTFLFHAHIVGRLAARLAGIRHVLSSQQVANWGGPVRQRLERWTARWCERVVAVSAGVRDDLVDRLGLPAEQVTVIFNAIEVGSYVAKTDPFARTAATGLIVIGSASRLAREKNHEALLRGFKGALATTPQLRLKLAGGGPLKPHLQQVIHDEGLSDVVELLGPVNDMQSFYEQLDIYVQPSRTEGLPCAVIEAMAMQRPVIATDVPGNRDAVIDGVTGHLIAADSAEAWTRSLSDLPTASRAVALGRAGRLRAEQLFDASKMITDTVQLLNELQSRKS